MNCSMTCISKGSSLAVFVSVRGLLVCVITLLFISVVISEIPTQEDQLDETHPQRRTIGRQIEKNVGLKRYRNRKFKNARTKLREKARKQTIRFKGKVVQYAPLKGSYAGEITGIKGDIVRSKSLKG